MEQVENTEASRRSDGTSRKTYKIRPGYIPLEEMPKYIIPAKRVIF